VSDALATELDSFTTGTVTRLAGANRYATAARVATTTFTAPIAQVLIATGAGCPCRGGPGGLASGPRTSAISAEPCARSHASSTAARRRTRVARHNVARCSCPCGETLAPLDLRSAFSRCSSSVRPTT
jgi:hypothetical protein